MANPLPRRLRTALFYALRTAFRLTPIPPGTRDRLRERFLDTKGHWVPEGPKGRSPTGGLPRRPYVRSDERAIGYVPYEKGELPAPLPATLVAFYLPQFHTIPENDAWWGKGFTEWRNVTRALPQFEGHCQPKLPGDLGFYDLRNVEVMHEQARLAREYGISAFCFYFYWFGGKTLLETPLRNWLNDKTIDLQFCLCWANEKWTRTWDGRGGEILIDQQHSPEDDIAFIEYVAEYMRDSRYLRIDGLPVLLIYRPGVFPDIGSTTARWRTWCRENGIGDIHLAYVQAFDSAEPHHLGFDAAVEFPPLRTSFPSANELLQLVNPSYGGHVFDWRQLSHASQTRPPAGYRLHPGVNPRWDNEARRPGRGRTFLYDSPARYGAWLRSAMARGRSDATPSPVFINAWNEWAEGAILEPCAVHGYAHLDATRRAVNAESTGEPAGIRACVIVHAWYVDAFAEILEVLVDWKHRPHLWVTAPASIATQLAGMLEASGISHELLVTENRGRDILPFLEVASRLVRHGFDVALKLHTKKSPHLRNGDDWRRELIQLLAGDGRGDKILAAFEQDPELGIVCPHGHLLELASYSGANMVEVRRIAALAGIGTIAPDTGFVSGSMFWVRLESLHPLLELPLRASDFGEEAGQIDGTLAHAIERLFAVFVQAAGNRVVTTGDLLGPDGQTTRAAHALYPYADRG
ncbi:MAG: hypothetical protein GXC75_07110 [Xanthomonadaceae bacterium]|nr:hypothetical protein [Xanthomonadaceae bacterium]